MGYVEFFAPAVLIIDLVSCISREQMSCDRAFNYKCDDSGAMNVRPCLQLFNPSIRPAMPYSVLHE